MISCQHLQVLATNLLERHWECQEEGLPCCGIATSFAQPCFMGSLDSKTAFDEAQPRHVASIMEGHGIHGLIISAFLREMTDNT